MFYESVSPAASVVFFFCSSEKWIGEIINSILRECCRCPSGARYNSRRWSEAKPPEIRLTLPKPQRGDTFIPVELLITSFILSPLRGLQIMDMLPGGCAALHHRLLYIVPSGLVVSVKERHIIDAFNR